MLIVFDGVYSAGKSTLIRTVLDRLRLESGAPVVVTEWNSSEIVGDLIPVWKRDGRLGAHSLLFVEAADLAHRCEQVIQAQLDMGGTVLADRYVLSAIARSVIRGADPALVHRVFDFAPRESLTVLVECAPEVTLRRREALGKHLGGYHSGRDYRRSASVADDFVRYQAEMAALYRTLAPSRGEVVAVNSEHPVERCVDTVLTAVAAVSGRGAPAGRS